MKKNFHVIQILENQKKGNEFFKTFVGEFQDFQSFQFGTLVRGQGQGSFLDAERDFYEKKGENSLEN